SLRPSPAALLHAFAVTVTVTVMELHSRRARSSRFSQTDCGWRFRRTGGEKPKQTKLLGDIASLTSSLVLLRDAVSDRFVTALGPYSQIAVSVRQFHIDLSKRSIVTLVRRVIGDEILRAQLFRDLRERTLEREHVAGEKCHATRFFR